MTLRMTRPFGRAGEVGLARNSGAGYQCRRLLRYNVPQFSFALTATS